METNVNYTIVGAFVILLTAAIILCIIWLSSGFNFEMYDYYLVYMTEAVSGLTQDSPVEYNGVTVGTVKQIKINRNNPKLVELLLSIKDDTPITRGTVATLNTRGITGINYIALKDDGSDIRPLEKPEGFRYPVIKTAPSFFLRLDIALRDFSRNFNQISESIHSLLDQENLKSIKISLHNLERITGSLAVSMKKFDVILENTSHASQQLTPLLQTSTTAMRMIETQTLPTVYNLMSNIESITSTLKDVSTQLKENPSMLIRGKGVGELGPGETKSNKNVELGPGETR